MSSRLAGLLFAFALIAASAVGQSSCISCHEANDQKFVADGGVGNAHLEDFRYSFHFRANVGCQDCHAGQADTFDKFRAHRGMLPSSASASRTNIKNLPATCGRCHSLIFDSFSLHTHWQLLQDGDYRAPGCTTCHGDTVGQSTALSERRCTACHSDEPDSMAAAFTGRGTQLLGLSREVGDTRRTLQQKIPKVRDAAHRHELEEAYSVAEVSWQAAIEAGHGFRWDEWSAVIARSRRDFGEVLANLPKR